MLNEKKEINAVVILRIGSNNFHTIWCHFEKCIHPKIGIKKRRWMMIHRLDIAEGNILNGLMAPLNGSIY
jgi:hypothetical protein